MSNQLHDNAGSIQRCIGLAERGDDPFATTVGRSEIDEQHLVVAVINNLVQFMLALSQVDWVELTFEDRVLQVISEIAHRLEDFAEPLVITDVIADEIGITHD